MKLRVRQRTAKAGLRAGVAGGVLIAGATIYASLGTQPLARLIETVGLVPPIAFMVLCLICAVARMALRKSPRIEGLALWLALARYVVNIAFPLAATILLPAWLVALLAGALVAPSLLQALLLTLVAFVMTTLSVGCALDLTLLLAPKPEKPATR